MKTRISFYVENKKETKYLGTIYGSPMQPNLKKGDKFWFNTDWIHPRTIDNLREQNYNENFIQTCIDMVEEKKGYRGLYKIVYIYRELKYNPNKLKEDESDYSMVI